MNNKFNWNEVDLWRIFTYQYIYISERRYAYLEIKFWMIKVEESFMLLIKDKNVVSVSKKRKLLKE